MKIDDLKIKIEQLQEIQKITIKNREAWNDLKKLVFATLNNIVEQYSIGWYVKINDHFENMESIYISFGNKPSGISENLPDKHKMYIKKGGTLRFSQLHNGKIYVVILYPSIENFVKEKEKKLIGNYSPESITEEFIIEKVGIFIQEMTDWEKSVHYKSMDHKINN